MNKNWSTIFYLTLGSSINTTLLIQIDFLSPQPFSMNLHHSQDRQNLLSLTIISIFTITRGQLSLLLFSCLTTGGVFKALIGLAIITSIIQTAVCDGMNPQKQKACAISLCEHVSILFTKVFRLQLNLRVENSQDISCSKEGSFFKPHQNIVLLHYCVC